VTGGEGRYMIRMKGGATPEKPGAKPEEAIPLLRDVLETHRMDIDNGSFSDGGQVADQSLNTAATNAAPVVENAVARTGEAARDAGAAITEQGRDLVEPRKD